MTSPAVRNRRWRGLNDSREEKNESWRVLKDSMREKNESQKEKCLKYAEIGISLPELTGSSSVGERENYTVNGHKMIIAPYIFYSGLKSISTNCVFNPTLKRGVSGNNVLWALALTMILNGKLLPSIV